MCETLNCEFKCRSSLEGGVCYCDSGMTINPVDKRTCMDLNECSEWGYCDQLCTNTEGSYKCSCSDGYSLVPPRHCKANNSKSHLFFFTIFLFSLSLSFHSLILFILFTRFVFNFYGVSSYLLFWSPSFLPFTISPLCLLHHRLSFILLFTSFVADFSPSLSLFHCHQTIHSHLFDSYIFLFLSISFCPILFLPPFTLSFFSKKSISSFLTIFFTLSRFKES